MPRNLPWQKGGGSTTLSRPKRPTIASPSVAPKRQRVNEASADDVPGVSESPRKEKAIERAPNPSTSPPPEPPTETFMNEGIDHDDKYRIVEDEFLSIAQRFTVHLHAAEYKRQQKMVKSRNADTINSISRPVTGKMPDQTRRKVEAVARAKTQKTVLAGLLGKGVGNGDVSDDSDDADGLPYVGTTLHGLMDSPRRKAASLTKLGTTAATTRAAAGFKQPAAQSKSGQLTALQSPRPKAALPRRQAPQRSHDSTTESEPEEEEDDDLDAPIPPPKLIAPRNNSVPGPNSHSSFFKTKSTAAGGLITDSNISKKPGSSIATAPTKNVQSQITKEPISSSSRHRPSRLEQARRQRLKEEKKQQEKKNRDIIPTFF